MRATFFIPDATRPVGGVRAAFEYANRFTRLGHEIHFFHTELDGRRVSSPDDISWFALEPGIHHHMIRSDGSTDRLPDADFLFAYNEHFPREVGLPVTLVQGYRMMRRDVEDAAYRAPCPKICVARWLVDVGRELGVPDRELVYVPYGIDHEHYRVLDPIAGRGPQVAMLYHSHPMKGSRFGLQALAEVKRRIPELSVVLFGSEDPPRETASWMHVSKLPAQDYIVSEIYNRSRVFVCPSVFEGFGFANVEAMASGCALVTSANGGSDDYARHGETALVSPAEDVGTMADHIEQLLVDDELCGRIARSGCEHVQQFDWNVSTRKLEAFLIGYGADPEPYLSRPAAPSPASHLFSASSGEQDTGD